MAEIKTFTTYFVNGYIIKGEKTILFDTGALVDPAELSGILAERGVSPEEIELIVISHAHYDHAMLAAAWKELTGAKIICHEKAVEYLKNGTKDPQFVFGPKAKARPKFIDFMLETTPPPSQPVEADILVGDEGLDMHPYGIPGEIVCTPGHDDTHIALVLDDRTAFSGDVFYDLHTVGALVDDYPEGSYDLNWICTDEELIKDSARKLLEMADTFYGGHGTPMDRSVIEPLVK